MSETQRFLPEALFEAGVTDLVSVIPPGAALVPSSKIDPAAIGKIPGRRLPNGLWAGYNWRVHEAALEDVRRWSIEGANVGLRADRFPAVDVDCSDEALARIIEQAALAKLGPAPVRIGKPPKRLLMYHTAEPFGRMRLWISRGKEQHLVEILGMGQQYLVHGTHPQTMRPYAWGTDLVAEVSAGRLTTITRDDADAFLTYLAEALELVGVDRVEREGDGRPLTRTAAADQEALEAPGLESLTEAVGAIPNTNDLFPDRQSYLTMGYAIKAAAGADVEEGFALFLEWAMKWTGNDRADGNDPDVVRSDWERCKPPFAVGWPWLAEQARAFGYNDAGDEFDALEDAPRDERAAPDAPREERATVFSDQWLAEEIVRRRRAELRFVPAREQWLVWSGSRWQPDAALLADDIVKRELRTIGRFVEGMGATDKEKKESLKLAMSICSGGKAATVRTLMQSDRAIAVEPDALDHDPWLLNTPAGLVNLRTGALQQADPDALCTRSAAVPADFGGACPEWRRFLAEATGGSAELQRYLQRLAGYALTGSTREQHLTFIWGPGGNGKSVFLNVLTAILADYARVATMDTFTASSSDKHSTDIAMLQGARLVTASETAAGKRWDEQRVKSLTGGEPVTARFMRQDNFTYLPQFKLVFVGNHMPEIRDVQESMRRRIHLVPFTVTPARVDRELAAKLRDEYPAILAWMIEGCLAWQREGLAAPQIVQDTTAEYFADEDALGRWLAERTCAEAGANVTTAELFQDWREWCGQTGEYAGSIKRFSSALNTRRLARWRDPATRRMGYSGVRLNDRQELGIL